MPRRGAQGSYPDNSTASIEVGSQFTRDERIRGAVKPPRIRADAEAFTGGLNYLGAGHDRSRSVMGLSSGGLEDRVTAAPPSGINKASKTSTAPDSKARSAKDERSPLPRVMALDQLDKKVTKLPK